MRKYYLANIMQQKIKKQYLLVDNLVQGKVLYRKKINEKKDYIPIDIDAFRTGHPRLNEILRDQQLAC